MKIYELKSHPKSMNITSDEKEDQDHPISSDFNGESKRSFWSPIKVETIYKKSYNDFPNYRIGKPVVSASVKKIIEPYIKDEVEFLPLLHDHLELYMVNVTKVLDCVDWKRSDIRTYDDGEFAGFNKLVFDFSKIPEGTYMFKFRERTTTRVYITQALKELIERNKFKGLDFSVVHDSEYTEEKEQEKQRSFEAALSAIENSKGIEYTYDDARDKVESGKAFVSGKWKMQLDDKGRFWIGELMLDLTYQWLMPVYIPPILLGQLWHEAEKSKV
ncbi:imm11 family protein [Paenibacillus sp. GCM10012307]|uniref:Immunity MXAN-0049 protein domain-containing protein n=1 Tax=Paenibacillus roseus TaxID=2798579 RepID=A0A934MNK8_9BACL|nr:DUF1629 domain-containing protein [Paenibacillus roseus]MBJ6361121.1 hypothetical protein [Paenibacillus roseus]